MSAVVDVPDASAMVESLKVSPVRFKLKVVDKLMEDVDAAEGSLTVVGKSGN